MKTLLSLAFSLLLFAPTLALAQPTQYELLAPIPLQGVSGGDTATTSAGDYIKGIFKLTIAIATGLAVIMIIFGGIKYMSTDAFSGKSEAKLIIENALWGLLLAIGAWIILYTINPKLVEFDLGLPKQEIPVNTNVPGPTSGPGSPTNRLSEADARSMLESFGVNVAPGIRLEGVREAIVEEVGNLRGACGCTMLVTSATGGSHAGGEYSHANGYKIDLRSDRDGAALTTYIRTHYAPIGTRSDGAIMYSAPTGALYALESNPPHWDVLRIR